MTRGRRGSLILRRRALPSPPPCRFIPALSLDPGPRQQIHRPVRRRVRQRGDSYPVHTDAGTRANAIAERGIATARRELLDRVMITNRRHLMAVLAEYVAHFNDHRPHRALNQAAPLRPLPPPGAPSQLRLRRRGLLDGLIHEYAQVTRRGRPVRHPQGDLAAQHAYLMAQDQDLDVLAPVSGRARNTNSSNSRCASRYTSEKITTGILPDPSNPPAVTCTAGHPPGTETSGTHKVR
jgi:hypothetical protein